MTETKEKTLISYFGDKKVKAKFLERVLEHKKADEIIKGQYWQNGRGCAVGCTIHGNNHYAYEAELGIPAWLAFLEDQIFESLPLADAKNWPGDLLEAIPVGVDLEPVKKRFLSWLMLDEEFGVINLTKDKDIKASAKIIGTLLAINADRPLTKAEVAEGDEPPGTLTSKPQLRSYWNCSAPVKTRKTPAIHPGP